MGLVFHEYFHHPLFKAFDYSSDFVGLFSSHGSNSFLILVASITLGVVLVIGISVELLGRKFKHLNTRFCSACCNKKTMVQELNSTKICNDDRNGESQYVYESCLY